jgi:hypothetical protein
VVPDHLHVVWHHLQQDNQARDAPQRVVLAVLLIKVQTWTDREWQMETAESSMQSTVAYAAWLSIMRAVPSISVTSSEHNQSSMAHHMLCLQ